MVKQAGRRRMEPPAMRSAPRVAVGTWLLRTDRARRPSATPGAAKSDRLIQHQDLGGSVRSITLGRRDQAEDHVMVSRAGQPRWRSRPAAG